MIILDRSGSVVGNEMDWFWCGCCNTVVHVCDNVCGIQHSLGYNVYYVCQCLGSEVTIASERCKVNYLAGMGTEFSTRTSKSCGTGA